MNKITFGFFRTKRNKAIQGLLALFVFLLMNTQTSWGQTLIAGWDFQTTSNGGTACAASPNSPLSFGANFGTGNMYLDGTNGSSTWIKVASGNEVTAFGGTALNAGTGFSTTTTAPACLALTGGAATPTSNGKFVVFKFSMAGYSNLIVSYASQKTTAGFSSQIWEYSTNGTVWMPVQTITTVTTSFSVITLSTITGLDNVTTAYLRFSGTGATTAAGNNRLDNIQLNATLVSTTWNGSAWSNGVPTASIEAIIDGTYNTNVGGAQGPFTAKKLTVNSGKSLTVNTGTNVTVQNEVVNNGALVVENNANLIQVNNVSNTGTVTVKRNSNPLYRLDYTMWSSPTGITQTLSNFSPLTTTTRFYEYNSGTNLYSVVSDATLFSPGKGFLIRMPNTDPTTGYDAGTATLVYPGVFTGVPNNGSISLTGLTPGQYVAVGNPYPSTISANAFINANTDSAGNGVLYFWRKTNNVNQGTSPTTSYATYTLAGGVGTGASNGGFAPESDIQVGQGFITTVPSAGTITFTNAMRSSNNSAQFLRTKAVAKKDRVWLSLSAGANPVNQMMVAYMDGATNNVDNGIDGKYINDSPVALTSSINNEEYVIQGRPAFEATDVVALNFKTDLAGTYTIAKDHADGLFANGQDVYLVDSKTGAETNLQTATYTFTAAAGADNSRFKLTYKTSGALKVNSQAFNENSIYVYKQNGLLSINAGTTILKNVKVFDMTGKLLAEQKSVNATTTSMKNLNIGKQSVLVQVTSEDNRVVTKKAIY